MKWISVKECFPMEGVPKFCCNARSNQKWVAWRNNGRWVSETDGFPQGRIEANVTHWLDIEPPPLPDEFMEWYREASKGSCRANPLDWYREIWCAGVASAKNPKCV